MAVTDESEHSQSDTITYDDPAGRMEREKIMAKLKRGCSPSPDLTAEEDEEINTTNKVGIPREKRGQARFGNFSHAFRVECAWIVAACKLLWSM